MRARAAAAISRSRSPHRCRPGTAPAPSRSIPARVAPASAPARRARSGCASAATKAATASRRSPGPIAASGRNARTSPATVGDFVLKRADGVFAYQLAVVVDDAEQGVTDVVRGEDLADSTARQIVLQRLLGVPTPRYLHTPLVRTGDGAKLSKQTGAAPLALDDPLAALREAGAVLGLAARGTRLADWLESALACWRERFVST